MTRLLKVKRYVDHRYCRTATPMYGSPVSCRPDIEYDSTPFGCHTQPQHVCAFCGKPRSRSYHIDHPIRSGEQPPPGVCSRTGCLRALRDSYQLGPPRNQVLVHEVHHYYHGVYPEQVSAPRDGTESRPASGRQPNTWKGISSIAELPGSDLESAGPNAVYESQQLAASAAHVNRHRKPVFIKRVV